MATLLHNDNITNMQKLVLLSFCSSKTDEKISIINLFVQQMDQIIQDIAKEEKTFSEYLSSDFLIYLSQEVLQLYQAYADFLSNHMRQFETGKLIQCLTQFIRIISFCKLNLCYNVTYIAKVLKIQKSTTNLSIRHCVPSRLLRPTYSRPQVWWNLL